MAAHRSPAPARPAHDPANDFAVPVKLWLPREQFRELRIRADRMGITVGELIASHLSAAPEPAPSIPGSGKLNSSQLAAIRHALARGADPAQLASIWGVSARTVSRIAHLERKANA